MKVSSFIVTVMVAAQSWAIDAQECKMVRTEGSAGSMARLLVRVHRHDCSTSFFDNLGNHPIPTSSWSRYEIQAPIAADARDVEFGMQLIDEGQAWIDGISVGFEDAK